MADREPRVAWILAAGATGAFSVGYTRLYERACLRPIGA